MSFQVQQRKCDTCIYSKESPLNLSELLEQIKDRHMPGHFKSWRVCHHSSNTCCRGFWDAHKDHFDVGQVAQRLGAIQFVDVDTLKEHDATAKT